MNPLLNPTNILGLFGFIIALGTVLGFFGRYLSKTIRQEISDTEAKRMKLETERDLARALADTNRDARLEAMHHKLSNVSGRVDGLEHNDTKREIEMNNLRNAIDNLTETSTRIEKSTATGFGRIEKQIEKLLDQKS